MEHNEQYQHSQARGSFVEALDPVRIQRLKTIVEDYLNQGKRKRYSILVDGEIVVPITSDPKHFDNYERYLLPSTRNVEVRMYFGASPKHNSHLFKASFNGLNGKTENVKEQIEQALEQQRQEHLIDYLKRELKRKNKKLKAYKALELELQAEKIDIKDLFRDGLNVFLANYNKNNPQTSQPALAGNTSQVEVEVEETTQSLVDQEFERLKKKFTEREILLAIKNWEDVIEYSHKTENK